MLTRAAILDVERTERAHHERVRLTFAARHQDSKSWKAWDYATSAWHAQAYVTGTLWSDGFLAALRASQRSAVDDAILYLEVDPWYFRSGYLKERLIRGVKAAELSEQDQRRLWSVVWNAAAGRNRREFRNYCSLAAVVGNADLIQQLEEVTPERDTAAQGKFRYLLGYLQKHSEFEKGRTRSS